MARSTLMSRNSLAYLGCCDLTCYKKAIRDNGDYFCTKCDVQFLEGVLRYNLKLKVKHKKSYANVILWDRDTQRLIGKVAREFSDHLDLDKSAPKGYPKKYPS